MPQVGVTHDVVIYDGRGNLDPVGLVIRPFSLRIGAAPTFIPRMAIGDPKGTDTAAFTSYVQEDMRGRSQVQKGTSHDYYRMVGMAPDRRTGDVTPLQPVKVVPTMATYGGQVSGIWMNPAGRTPVVHGVEASYMGISIPWVFSDVRVMYGYHIVAPGVNSLGDVVSMHVMNTVPNAWKVFDAVQFSTLAWMSTYAYSPGTNAFYWKDMYCHYRNTIFKPEAYTTAGALAVYDERLWRGEPSGANISYYDMREAPTAHDSEQGALVYEGEGGDAEFSDVGQDFTEWETEAGEANYKIVVTNDDASECWGYLGLADTEDDEHVMVYKERDLSTRGWLGDTATPVTDTKTASTYEVRDGVPPEEEVTGWSAWIALTPTAQIISMTPFIGRLFIGATDGLWAYEAGRTYMVVDFSGQAHPANFTVLKSAHGSLWFNIGPALYRYTAGGLLEEMDFTPRVRGYGKPGIPQGLCQGPGCIYISVGSDDPTDGYTAAIYRLDIETGAAQEVVNAIEYVNTAGTYRVFYGTVFPATRAGRSGGQWGVGAGTLRDEWLQQRLIAGPGEWNKFVGYGGKMGWLNFGPVNQILSQQDFVIDPPDTRSEDIANQNQHFWDTTWWDFGYPHLDKVWQRVSIEVSGLVLSAATVDVYYKQARDAAWQVLGKVNEGDLDEYGRATLEFTGGGAVAKQMQFRFDTTLWQAEGGLGNSRVCIPLVEADAILGPNNRRRLQFNAVVTDQLELLDRTIENSAAWVATAMYSLSASGVIHTVGVPYPPPMGHTIRATVQLGPIGAVVPVLSYTGLTSTCPGADMAVVISEV